MDTTTPTGSTPEPEVDAAALAAAEAAKVAADTVETPLPQEVEKTEREKLLDGVDSVLKPSSAPADDQAVVTQDKPADAPVVEEKPTGDKPGDNPVEELDKDDDKLEFKDHPRFKALREEAIASRASRKEFDTKLAEANSNLVPLTNLRGFLADSGVSGDEFSEGLRIMRALKNDPLEAARLLAPHMQRLNVHTGDGPLPDALASRVATGEISEAAAREIVRHQTAAEVAQKQAARTVQQASNVDSQRLMLDAQSAVQAWEANLKATDPEYARRQALTIRLIQSSASTAAPRTPQDAISLANAAYEEASRLLPKVAPLPKPATKPAPSTSTSSQSRVIVKAKPKNLLDGVSQVLAGLGS